jgi:hypothetical protein
MRMAASLTRAIVGGALFVSGGDGTVVFDLVEEALDEVPVAIEDRAEHWWGDR